VSRRGAGEGQRLRSFHLKTDFDGLPSAFEPTGGEAADGPQFETLIDLGPDDAPRAVVAGEGYDSDANRALARQRGAVPVIPHRSNRKAIPARFARAPYRGRARIEQAVGKLRRLKRIAQGCEKTARNFRAFVAFAAALVSIKSVHTAWAAARRARPPGC
jgi:hypothetical protein